MNVSCSHSLAELSSAAVLKGATGVGGLGGLGGGGDKDDEPDIYVQSVGRKKIVLERRTGVYFKTRLVPNGQTLMVMMVAEGHEPIECVQLDDDHDEDWDVCKKNASSNSSDNHVKIDNVRKATKLCVEAVSLDPSTSRHATLINQAWKLAKDTCPLVHYIKADIQMKKAHSIDGSNTSRRKKRRAHEEEVIRHLKDAVAAGRAFVNMINAHKICPGNLYQFVPTRWCVRVTYLLGSYSFLMAADDKDSRKYDRKLLCEADKYFKETLAIDIQDKLGARHKQLLVQLARQGGPSSAANIDSNDDQLQWLLEAKFGEDQDQDRVLALWNYTRALHAYRNRSNRQRANELLEYAIKKNPYFPPILLGWELPIVASNGFMPLGSQYEASEYWEDNAQYWLTCGEDVFSWVESVYCGICSKAPLTHNDAERQLFIEGTRILDTCLEGYSGRSSSNGRFSKGVEAFDRLLDVMEETDEQGLLSTTEGMQRRFQLRAIVFGRKALCHKALEEYETALEYLRKAQMIHMRIMMTSRDNIEPKMKDDFKELIYQCAQLKELRNDYQGALEEYRKVYERFGSFSTAIDGIKRMERKLNVPFSASVLRRPRVSNDYENQEEMTNKMEKMQSCLPPIDPSKTVAATLEKCYNCKRGGMKLAKCSACSDVKFCSKECLTASWKEIHKYACSGSKHQLKAGDKVSIQGLEGAKQHNGKIAVIEEFLDGKDRFCVQIVDGDSSSPVQLSIKPKNLKKVIS